MSTFSRASTTLRPFISNLRPMRSSSAIIGRIQGAHASLTIYHIHGIIHKCHNNCRCIMPREGTMPRYRGRPVRFGRRGVLRLRLRQLLETRGMSPYGLPTRSVAPTPAALERLRSLDRPLPDGPADPAAVLAELDAVGSPATMATAGGRFFGFVIGGSLPAALAASWLAAAWDQDAGRAVMAPGAAAFEEVALRWLLEALGLPAESAGGFVTGATMA